jgi:hypothetical protein
VRSLRDLAAARMALQLPRKDDESSAGAMEVDDSKKAESWKEAIKVLPDELQGLLDQKCLANDPPTYRAFQVNDFSFFHLF